MREVGIIIPYWHTHREENERLIRCLDHVSKQTVDCDITVVDNGSFFPVHAMNRSVENATIISFPENRGYAKAINAGMRLDSHPYNLFLNDDCYMHPNCVENLLSVARDGFVPMAFTAKDGYPDPVQDFVVGSIDGSCWMVSKEHWDVLGPLDEQFGYGGFEDADYFQRMDNIGIKYGVVGNAVAHHEKEQTISKLDKMRLHEENKAKFIAKWGVLR